MKFRKLVFECGLIAASIAVISASSAVSVSAAETVTDSANAGSEQNETENSETNQNPQEDSGDEPEEEVPEEMSGEESSVEGTSEEQISEEISGWADKLLVVVEEDSSLNIHKEPDTDSEIVGKMSRGAAAEVVEQGEEWSKIVSGDVEGYVCNEYCVFAGEAEAQAAEICTTEATVTEDGVRLRGDASTESIIYKVLEEGESLTVSDDAEETAGGWIPVRYGDGVAYVSSDYVEVELAVGEAVSMEEIYEQQAAEKAAAEQAAAKEAAATQTSSSGNTAASASSDDLSLLAAIIYCEAGAESYEGQLAVGAVVMNRVKSGSFPNSISGVIYQSGQFSPASSGKLSRVLGNGSATSSCYQAAQAAINGEDNTGGALYFHAGSGNGTVIGNQVFY
ncbi:MAG: cell wall hydrolase [Lachnospiraceae bacterium]|nr:cell wall hydrolase [Lachnospiraceae bacterium]